MNSDIQKEKFGRIGVLMGGPSTEREISLKSGKGVYQALKDSGCDVVAIDLISDNEQAVIEAIKNNRISVAFIALHGRFGEDGTIQHILDQIKIPYTGSDCQASRLAMDKISSRKKFLENRLSVPNHYNLNKSANYSLSQIIDYFKKFPLVVKPSSQGSSIGITLVRDEQNLGKALEIAFGFDEDIIVEEFILGRELTVGILEERYLPVVEIIPQNPFFDFQAKYSSGHTRYVVPAQLQDGLSRRVQEVGLLAHRALGCYGFSRVDLILNQQNQPIILEVNTIPGFTPTSLLPKAAAVENISFAQLCLKLIRLAYEKK